MADSTISDTNEFIGILECQLVETLNLSGTSSNSDADTSGHSDNNSSFSESALEKLEYYCIALDEMIEIGTKFIETRREVSSLREIRRQLSITSTNNATSATATERYAVIEDNVPEELKCPVCFEIFESEVFQCINGHSICFRCCDTLNECPECRANYREGKVRNRTVEKLMKSLKIDCLYWEAGCREKMSCGEMQVHVETCEFMNKPVRSAEYREVRKQLKSRDGDSKRLEKRMIEANKRLMESKSAWKTAKMELCSHRFGSQLPTSMENRVKEFRLEEKEEGVTFILADLTTLITVPK